MEAGLPKIVPRVEVHVGEDGELPAGLDESGTRGQHERRPIVLILQLQIHISLNHKRRGSLLHSLLLGWGILNR